MRVCAENHKITQLVIKKEESIRSCQQCLGDNDLTIPLRKYYDFCNELRGLLTDYKQYKFTTLKEQIVQIQNNLIDQYEQINLIDLQGVDSLLDIIDKPLEKYQREQFLQIKSILLNKKGLENIKSQVEQCLSMQKLLQKCVQLLNVNKVSKTKQEEHSQNLEPYENFIIKQDNLTQNSSLLEGADLYQINTKFHVKHIYNATLLDNNIIGLALGEKHPYYIYDLSLQAILQKISIEKNSIYDSVMIDKDRLILGGLKTIFLFNKVNGKFVQSEQQFQPSKSQPNKLIYSSVHNSIFSTDFLTQLQDNQVVNQWSLFDGVLTKYQIDYKTSGAINLSQDQKYLAAGEVLLNKSSKTGKVIIWKVNETQPTKILRVDEPIYSVAFTQGKIIGFGTKVYVWLMNYNKIEEIIYPGSSLNALSILIHGQNILIGDNTGKLMISDYEFKKWQEILKIGCKIMKITNYENQFLFCSWDTSFCVFTLK
ncbi:hypothetical protein pb186bvf_015438 [Paramecium bursaria]